MEGAMYWKNPRVVRRSDFAATLNQTSGSTVIGPASASRTSWPAPALAKYRLPRWADQATKASAGAAISTVSHSSPTSGPTSSILRNNA